MACDKWGWGQFRLQLNFGLRDSFGYGTLTYVGISLHGYHPHTVEELKHALRDELAAEMLRQILDS